MDAQNTADHGGGIVRRHTEFLVLRATASTKVATLQRSKLLSINATENQRPARSAPIRADCRGLLPLTQRIPCIRACIREIRDETPPPDPFPGPRRTQPIPHGRGKGRGILINDLRPYQAAACPILSIRSCPACSAIRRTPPCLPHAAVVVSELRAAPAAEGFRDTGSRRESRCGRRRGGHWRTRCG
jgi:hypothetical protein